MLISALHVTPHLILAQTQGSGRCCSPPSHSWGNLDVKLIYLLWFKELTNSSQDVFLDHLRPGLYVWACAYFISNPVCSQHRIPLTSAGQTEPSAFQAARSGISTRKRAWDPWGQWGWEQRLFLWGFRWFWLFSTSTVCLVLIVNLLLTLPCSWRCPACH